MKPVSEDRYELTPSDLTSAARCAAMKPVSEDRYELEGWNGKKDSSHEPQ